VAAQLPKSNKTAATPPRDGGYATLSFYKAVTSSDIQ
jgi:hypothetical protein